MNSILDTAEMANLLTLVEEAARSTKEGVKHFVEPAPGTLRRTSNKRHHIVFGRRGSGKSSLLQKAASDLTVDRRPIATVNLEAFKGHSYPDPGPWSGPGSDQVKCLYSGRKNFRMRQFLALE